VATPCGGMACAGAPLSMLSTVSAGRVHVGLSTNRSWSQPCTQPARLLLPAGRFGCRADCGRLQDIQNLTAVRIDLDYDFSHPSGSIPATASVLGGRRGSRPEQPCSVCCGRAGWWAHKGTALLRYAGLCPLTAKQAHPTSTPLPQHCRLPAAPPHCNPALTSHPPHNPPHQ